MTAQSTANMDDEASEAPPPMAAVSAARRQQIEEARMQERPPVARTGAAVFLGFVVLALAALSAVAAWVAS